MLPPHMFLPAQYLPQTLNGQAQKAAITTLPVLNLNVASSVSVPPKQKPQKEEIKLDESLSEAASMSESPNDSNSKVSNFADLWWLFPLLSQTELHN
jgi:hypothetical protein